MHMFSVVVRKSNGTFRDVMVFATTPDQAMATVNLQENEEAVDAELID